MMGLYMKEKIIFFIINKYKRVIVNKKRYPLQIKINQNFPSNHNIPLLGKIYQKLLVDCIM